MFLKICNRVIEYGFYALFLLTPLAFTSLTSELFELNKMWLVWALTVIITGSWLIKMVLQKRFLFQRTPLDIPIGLFLASQIISTIFSLDSHTSFWGYYSRFNGGLLSIISYILLYYTFLSNFSVIGSQFSVFGYKSIGLSVNRSDKLKTGKPESDNRQLKTDNWNLIPAVRMVKRLLFISLISGAIVALWGLPSHFGFDPTCFVFRGTFDVSCWTADFLPKVRIFSTLGQPDWLAAYLAILIPISIAFLINSLKSNSPEIDKKYRVSSIMYYVSNKKFILTTYYILLATLFYVDLLYTRARSGFLAIWISLLFFAGFYYWAERKRIKSSFLISHFSFLIGLFLLVTFIIGTPIGQLNKFTLEGIKSNLQKERVSKTASTPAKTPEQPVNTGGTESGDIRLFVWEGAVNAWRANPIFGTGVETFAFAYYKYKPIGQNLTSEWNFLYNKAHNEYLNYLATTGVFGLGTYIIIIAVFLWLVLAKNTNLFAKFAKEFESVREKQETRIPQNNMLILALVSGYISILVTNFFGFSVVITNVYLFMIPAFVFVLMDIIKSPTAQNKLSTLNSQLSTQTSIWQWTPIFFILVTCCLLIVNLFKFWQADISYALGYNLDRAGEYQQGYPQLRKAVELRGGEPVFKDELSLNNAIIAAGLVSQKPNDSNQETINIASSLAQQAIDTSNEIVSKYPNNAVFWKTRTRLFFTLSQVDSRYLPRALDAIEKASLLAPNDANIWYNFGVLQGQNNNVDKGIEIMEKVVKIKPDYRDAHYALGLFYRTSALDKTGKVVADENLNQKAIEQMQYILDKISPKDPDALKALEEWSKT